MIRIKKIGTNVGIEFSTGLVNSSEQIVAITECDNPMFAELLRDKLQSEMSTAIQAIRESEYNRGWADSRKKKVSQKVAWFSPGWKVW
jgi:hypothetical protein